MYADLRAFIDDLERRGQLARVTAEVDPYQEITILIDARWKKGYPQPVEFDPAVERRINARWSTYGIHLDGYPNS